MTITTYTTAALVLAVTVAIDFAMKEGQPPKTYGAVMDKARESLSERPQAVVELVKATDYQSLTQRLRDALPQAVVLGTILKAQRWSRIESNSWETLELLRLNDI